MKILFSHFGIYKKGGWGRSFSLASGLVELGNNVTLMTNNPGYSLIIKKKYIEGVHVIIFPDILPIRITSKGFGFLSLILRLTYALFNKFEILHSDSGHRPLAGWPCLLNRFLYKGKYVAEWWDYFGKGGQLENKPAYFRKLFGKFESWSEIHDKKSADGIVVLSEYMEKHARSSGITSEIVIIHGGADVKHISYNDLITDKSKFGISANKIAFGYIGMSNSEIDDLLPFIHALNKFKDDVVFITYGKKLSKETILKYSLEGVIKEMGWIDYSKDSVLLALTDVFVLIKRDIQINRVGWPNKLGDYLACGRAVLINPYGDILDFVSENKQCFIITTWNQSDIENKVQKIISDHFQINEMGKKARRIAENKISWLNCAVILNNFYKKV